MVNSAAVLLLAALENATAVWRTLAAALEHIPGAAFVIDLGGELVYANTLGNQRLEHEGTKLARRLAEAARGTDPELEVHAATRAGHLLHYLVIARPAGDTAQMRAAEATTRWGLTARQHDVLTCVLRGHSNARVSLELGISERTVEVHMTAIFDRARCASRTELIASVLMVA